MIMGSDKEKIKVVKPTEGRILLKKIKEPEQKTINGLILPSTMPKQDRYEVIESSGNEVTGDIVYIEKYKAIEVIIDDEPYYIIQLEDIIAHEYQQETT